MPAKTYRAKSIQEAIARIKMELGADALILNTRRIAKGPRDPYGRDLFEVTAAPAGATDLPETAEPVLLGKPDRGGQEWLSKDRGGRRPTLDPAPEMDDIRAELVSIKDMLILFNRAGGLPDFLRMHPECLNLYARLVKAGVSEHRVRGVMEKADGFSGKHSPQQTAKAVIQEIVSHLQICDPFDVRTDGRQVAAFIGPTGVGKTTTIAKLGAELSLKQKKRVGVISLDSYRIGAVDQLRTYAEIMGLACLPAFSPEEFRKSLSQLGNVDVILVDTAGQSHLDMARMRELGRLMEGGEGMRCHLVLSATAKPEDMREAAENFATLSPASYVFTKVDETRTRGVLIDQVMALPLPVSYIANGQRVPEDIMGATKRRILDLVLGQR